MHRPAEPEIARVKEKDRGHNQDSHCDQPHISTAPVGHRQRQRQCSCNPDGPVEGGGYVDLQRKHRLQDGAAQEAPEEFFCSAYDDSRQRRRPMGGTREIGVVSIGAAALQRQPHYRSDGNERKGHPHTHAQRGEPVDVE